jgi:hypothetical protein
MEWSFGAMIRIRTDLRPSRSVLDDKGPMAFILTGSATAVLMQKNIERPLVQRNRNIAVHNQLL